MIMKKVLSILLLLAMVLTAAASFTACDSALQEQATNPPETAIESEAVTEAATEAATEEAPGESGLSFTLLEDGTYSVSQGTALQNTTDIVIPATYNGKAVTQIADKAFAECRTLTSIVIPDSVTTIGEDAFLFCSSLTEITLPKGLTAINNSFGFCEKLTGLTIPAGVTEIDPWAFSYCSEMTAFVVDEGNTAYCAEDGVLFSKDKTMLVAYPLGKAGEYTVPEGVTTIGTVAFYTSEKLTAVTLPASLTTIESLAFSNCDELTQLTVAEANPVLCSVDGVVFNKDKTELIAFPPAKAESYAIPEGVTSVASFAFSYNEKLASITFPSSLTSIDSYAFSYCDNLIVKENGVHYVGAWAVDADYSATELPLRDGTVGIANSAFYGRSDVTSATIPEGVVTLGDWTFAFCDALVSITIPASVQKIDRFTFYNCSGMTDIHYAGTKEAWNAMEKVSDWDSDLEGYTVHCTDGDITKS